MIVIIYSFPAHDELGMCRINLASPDSQMLLMCKEANSRLPICAVIRCT